MTTNKQFIIDSFRKSLGDGFETFVEMASKGYPLSIFYTSHLSNGETRLILERVAEALVQESYKTRKPVIVGFNNLDTDTVNKINETINFFGPSVVLEWLRESYDKEPEPEVVSESDIIARLESEIKERQETIELIRKVVVVETVTPKQCGGSNFVANSRNMASWAEALGCSNGQHRICITEHDVVLVFDGGSWGLDELTGRTIFKLIDAGVLTIYRGEHS